MMLSLILGFATTAAIISFSAYHIVRFIGYKRAQEIAPVRLPLKKIKEFYNLAPDKYSVDNCYGELGTFVYTPNDYVLYEKEYIMGDSYISWLRSLRFIRQIKNNKVVTKNNTHTRDYLQYVLKDAQALQAEAQNQMNYVLGEIQKPPVDSITAYCENNKLTYDFEMGIDPNTREE